MKVSVVTATVKRRAYAYVSAAALLFSIACLVAYAPSRVDAACNGQPSGNPLIQAGPNPQPPAIGYDLSFQNYASGARANNSFTACCAAGLGTYSCMPTLGQFYPTGSPSPMFPYGPFAGDTKLGACDDCTFQFALTGVGNPAKDYIIPFFGRVFNDYFYIANNGLVSFGFAIPDFTPQKMPTTIGVPMIAAYWMDIDTRNNFGAVWTRMTTNTSALAIYTTTLRASFLGASRFAPVLAVTTTWDAVGYFGTFGDLVSTFQLIIVTDKVQTYAMFNYGYKAQQQIRGTHPSSVNSYSQVGFDLADGKNYYNAIGTFSNNMRDLWFLSKTFPDFPGRQAFRIDSFNISSSPTFLSPNGNLTNVICSFGPMSPTYSIGRTAYTISVPAGTSITFTTTYAIADQEVKIGLSPPQYVTSPNGVPGPAFVISTSQVVIQIRTNAPDLDDDHSTLLTITVQPLPSQISTLDALSIVGYTFDQGDYSVLNSFRNYTITVPSSVSSVTFTGTTSDTISSTPSAVCTLIGGATSGPGFTFSNQPLGLGNTSFVFMVTAAAGVNYRTFYKITITVKPSTDANILSVAVAGFPVTNSTNGQTYFVTVFANTTAISVTATARFAAATVSINNGPYSPAGVLTAPIAGLAFGQTTYSIRIKAEAGSPIQNYQFTVTRPFDTDATLAGITLATDLGYPLQISPPFSRFTTSYAATAQSWTAGATVTASLYDGGLYERMTLGGSPLNTDTQSSIVTLTPSLTSTVITTLTIVVTAQDLVSTRTYTIDISRPQPPQITAGLWPACTSVVYEINRNEYQSARITNVGVGGEILHVAARSNRTSAGAPTIWLEKGALPNVGGSLGAGYIATSEAVAGDVFAHATIVYTGSANDYFVTFTPESGAQKEFKIYLDVCSYIPQNVTLFGSATLTVPRNQFAFFATTPSTNQYLPGLEFLTTPAPALANPNARYLDTDSAVAAVGSGTRMDVGSYFGASVPATNPIAGTGTFSSYVIAPVANVRVLYAVFAVADLAVVPAPLASYTITVQARPTAPVIQNVNPLNGGTGGTNQITITLAPNTGEPRVTAPINGNVTIGGQLCTGAAYDLQSRIVCAVPAGQGAGLPIVVTLYTRSSPAFVQTYSYDPPTLSTVTWTAGSAPTAGDGLLTVNGQNFGLTATVTVRGVDCPVQTRTPHTQLICKAPAGEGTVSVAVIAAGALSTNTKTYTYDAPVLTAAPYTTNAATAGGNPLTIFGINFGRNATTGPVTVTVGGNPCTNPKSNQTQIVCTLPAGAGQSQAVVVTVAGVPNTGSQTFSYTGPTLSTITPNPVPVLTTILTLTGFQFGPSTTSLVISALGGACAMLTRNETYITCTPPARGVGSPVDAFVTVGGQPSGTVPLNWKAPQLTSISPQVLNTAGGDVVVVRGTDLIGASGDYKVRFNGVDLPPLAGSNSTVSLFTNPSSNPAGVMVPVMMNVGLLPSNTIYVNYSAPVISGISFSSGTGPYPDGSSTALISGVNFGPAGSVTVQPSGLSCSVAGGGWSTGAITCTVPAGVGSGITFRVTVNGQTSAPSSSYAYLAPSLTALTTSNPSGVSTAGGDSLQITGRNFGTSQGVGFVQIFLGNGQIAGCSVAGWSDTSISCSTPIGNGTNLQVLVNQAGLTGSRVGLNYLSPTISTATAASFPTAGGVALAISGVSLDSYGSVTVNGTNCPVISWSNALGQVSCQLPAGGGSAQPVVITTSGGKTSNSYPITYNSPSISAVDPPTLTTAGQVLTITGLNFGAKYQLSSVTVGGLGGNTITFLNHTRIVFTLGATPQSSTAPIVVTYAGLSSAGYTVGLSAPFISGLNPANGPTGPTYNITIQGQYFGDGTRATSVAFGLAPCTIITVQDAAIVCRVPAGVDSALVQVTVGTQPSNSVPFQYDRPSVVKAVPNLNLATGGGDVITVLGKSFGTNQATVYLNGAALSPAAVTFNNDTVIRFTMPAGVGAGIIVSVKVSSQTSTETSSTLAYAGPIVTSVAPNTAGVAFADPDGTDDIFISGSGFGSNPAVVTVLISGAPCTVRTAGFSPTGFSCGTPAGQGTGFSIVVNVNGQPTGSGYPFRYLAPRLDAVTVQGTASPAGGSSIFLTGDYFGTSGVVSVNGTGTCSVSVPSWYQMASIQCSLPAGFGNVLIMVTVGGQSSATLVYRYAAPVITASGNPTNPLPDHGPTLGGTTIVVSGNHLSTSGLLLIGNSPCVPINTGWTNQRVECVTPAGPGGASSVITVTVGGQSATSSFNWDAPIITSVGPIPGPTASGLGAQPTVALTIAGVNFGFPSTPMTITWNGQPYAALSHNQTHAFLASIPKGTGAGVNLVVSLGATPSAIDASFRYRIPTITSISAVTGCTNSGGTVIDCATTGLYNITIVGVDLGFAAAGDMATVLLAVGATNPECTGVEYLSTDGTRLRCQFPAIPLATVSLKNLPLTVTVRSQDSVPRAVSYAGPVLTFNTLRLASAPTPKGNITLNSINGTDLIHIDGQFLGPVTAFGGSPAVKFGLRGAAPAAKEYTCNAVTVPTSLLFECNVPYLTIGKELTFVYFDGQQWSAESIDHLSFPKPQFVPLTIADNSQAAGVDTNVNGDSSQGGFVRFAIRNVGNDASKLTIYYDVAGGAFSDPTRQCTSVTIYTPFSASTGATIVQCRTQPGSGGPYRFKVSALNQWSDESTDTYSYPQAPIIYQVLGAGTCVNNLASNSTANCPTTGVVFITLIGINFRPLVSQNNVLVGSNPCPVQSASPTQVVCQLPAGTGQNVPITIFGLFASQPLYKLSYAFATVTGVSGCAVNTPPTTSGCLRGGTQTLTVTGSGFGPSGAYVFVGPSRCTFVNQISDTQLTCISPAGTGLSTPVLVIQASGTLSSNSGSLSYAQCAVGSYQSSPSDYACTACGQGKYSDVVGLGACKPCPVGSATQLTGQSVCAPCSQGYIAPALGSFNCTACGNGQFTDSTGQGVCQTCPAQTYAAGVGNTGCTPCPAGQASSGTGVTTCTNCTAGNFQAAVGGGNCQSCPPGTFNTLPGSSSCTPCPIGSVQPGTGQSQCVACTAGFAVSSPGQIACVACESGKFSNVTLKATCDDCPKGSWSKKTGTPGATACTLCAAGSYLDVAAQSDCLQCPKGKFASGLGATTCVDCAPGSVAATVGLTQCTNCSAGFTATAPGLAECVICPTGTYTPSSGVSSCLNCAIGSYNPTPGASGCILCGNGGGGMGVVGPYTGQESCVACDAGFFMNTAGQSVCTPCAIGRYAPAAHATGCIDCSIGTFAPSGSSAGCTQCPAGKAVNTTQSSTCTNCAKGFISALGASVCTGCPAGQYAPVAGSATCAQCPIGEFTNTTGNFACTKCPPGTFQPSVGATVCTQCLAGQYSSSDSQSACLPCAIGTVSATSGSAACTACQTGYFAPFTQMTGCSACQAGTSTLATGQAVCPACQVGTYASQPGLATCSPCAKGSFASGANQTVCTPCPTGSYAPDDGAVSCVSCPVGKFQSNTGATTCTSCPAGSVQPNPGRSTCDLCTPGTVQPTAGQAVCNPCPVGQVAFGSNQTACALCVPGKSNGQTGQSLCTTCGSGTFSSVSGAAGCTPCQVGKYYDNVTFTTCQPCAAGTVRAAEGYSFCDPCGLGTFAPVANSAFCLPCPAGYYADQTGLAACKPCPVGSACPAGSQAPVACGAPAATYTPALAQGSCLTCAPGRFMNQTGLSSCLLCAPGKFSDSGKTVCSDCLTGRFSSANGAPQCDQCAAGRFAVGLGSSACQMCAAGYWQPGAGAISCDPAETGYFVPIAGQAVETLCPFGTIAPSPNATACTPCAAGTVQNYGSPTVHPITCTNCVAGKYSPTAGQQNCLSCDAGTFSNVTGLSACYQCPIGKSSGPQATGCSPCLKGTFAATAGSALCLPCPARTYAAFDGVSACTPCANSTYANVTGLSACINCEVGTFADQTNSLQCAPCLPGTYQDLGGKDSCKPCAIGSYTDTSGQSVCKDCAAGNYAPNTGSLSCTPCPVGTFAQFPASPACDACPAGTAQPQTGQQGCVDCTPGSANFFTGQGACTQCPPGSIAPLPAAQICQLCAAGKFTRTDGKTVCDECDTGSYNPSLGKTVCSLCDKGYFMNVTGSPAVVCNSCPAGQYQDAVGQSICLTCLPGTINPAEHAETCTGCEIGKYNAATDDRVSCTSCAAGSYQDQTKQLSCLLCPAGKQSAAAATACSTCAIGKISAVNGSAQCNECPFGQFQSLQGKSACESCAAGRYADQKQLSACFECEAGTASDLAASQVPCDPCSQGRYQPAIGQVNCTLCEAGKFNTRLPVADPISGRLHGESSCEPCPVGRFTNTSGVGDTANGTVSGTCMLCPAGKFNDQPGRSYCDDCAPGTYKAISSPDLCTSCANGDYAPDYGMTVCTFCEAGRYSNDNTGSKRNCTACSPGSAAADQRQSSCNLCDVRTFASEFGSKNCTRCPVGTAVNVRGAHSCSPCLAGNYQDQLGQQVCVQCEAGKVTNETGTVNCQACYAGSFQGSPGQHACSNCTAGSYTPTSGQVQCTVCDPGFYQFFNGSTGCTPCAAGYYQSLSAQRSCLECPIGKFSHEAAAACSTCGDGTVAPSLHASTCYACDPRATADVNRAKCLCNVGFAAQYHLSNETGLLEATCVECPIGANCERVGTEYDTMERESGYYCTVPGVYYRCLIDANCPAGQCSSALCGAGEVTCDACAEGRTGPLCAYCLSGWSQDAQGNCQPCNPDKLYSYIYTAVIIAIFCILLIIGCVIMVRSGSTMMDVAAREDEKLRLKAEGYIQNFNEGFNDDQWRFGRYISLRGAPPPKPDFTFKLKILLGFVQIITNLAVGLQIEWPAAFKAFLQAMNPANLDFVKFSSIDCIRRPSYYDQLELFALIPPGLLILLILFYFIPQTCRNLQSSNEGKAWRKRVRRNFWKVWLFLLFLVYPTVSATVLRLYVCVEVDGNRWLLADLTTSCDTDQWRQAALANLVLVFLYPIMIPVFFFLMLYRYRKRLDQSGVRAELGFLYDGYERSFYQFELVDMLHKLCITSLIAFVDSEWQLRAAMLLVTVYLIVILLGKPYIRKGDDILHCFVQVEVLLLLMAGYVFLTLSGPDSVMDGLLSVVLIVAVLGLFLYFLVSAANVLWKWLKHTECGQRFACIRGKEEDQLFSVKATAAVDPNAGDAVAGAAAKVVQKKKKKKKVDNSIGGEMKRLYRIDRHTMRQHGRVATARGAADDDAVAMVRNAAWGDAELAKASVVSEAATAGTAAAFVAPRANTVADSPHAASSGNAQTNLISPRRALLEQRLAEGGDAQTASTARASVELAPLHPVAAAPAADTAGRNAPAGSVLNIHSAPSSVPAEQLTYAGAPAPAAVPAADAQRTSSADLFAAQPLGTTPAGAPAAIELQPVQTAPLQPIQMAEFAALPTLDALPTLAASPTASSVAAVPVPAVVPPPFVAAEPAAFAPIAPIAAPVAVPAPYVPSAIAPVPTAVADVPAYAPIPAIAPMPELAVQPLPQFTPLPELAALPELAPSPDASGAPKSN